MILDETIKVVVNNRNRRYYEEKGYTDIGNELVVYTKDLPPHSKEEVNVQCDYCNTKFKRKIRNIQSKIACENCVGLYTSETKQQKIVDDNKENIEVEGSTCILHIGDDKVLFDYDDLYLVIMYRWFLSFDGFAITNAYYQGNKRSTLFMHRLIMVAGADENVYHKSRNRIDNRKSNLMKKPINELGDILPEPKKSPYKGVSYHRQMDRYDSRLRYKGSMVRIGYFTDEIACANAYNYFSKILYGDTGPQNDVEYMPVEVWASYRVSKESIEDIVVKLERLKRLGE